MAVHPTNLEISRSVPPELDAGVDTILKVKVLCRAGCDLLGSPVKVLAADEVVITSELATHGEAINETDDFALKAPEQVGAYAWTILFPRCEIEGIVHQ